MSRRKASQNTPLPWKSPRQRAPPSRRRRPFVRRTRNSHCRPPGRQCQHPATFHDKPLLPRSSTTFAFSVSQKRRVPAAQPRNRVVHRDAPNGMAGQAIASPACHARLMSPSVAGAHRHDRHDHHDHRRAGRHAGRRADPLASAPESARVFPQTRAHPSSGPASAFPRR